MRKQTKIAALVSAAALLAIGASMTASANTWRQNAYHDYTWVDGRGNAIEEEGWHRGNITWSTYDASQYYFSDENGNMVFDQPIEWEDNLYYVDENGYRVTNTWKWIDLEDGYTMPDGTDVDSVCCFFGSNGKAVHAAADKDFEAKTVIQDTGWTTTGTFVFSEEGYMILGRVEVGDNNDVYYCVQPGDANFIGLSPEGTAWPYVTGQALNGWAYMDVETLLDDAALAGKDYNNAEWFWFNNCKLHASAGVQAVSGVSYVFDENGVLGAWGGKSTLSTAIPPEQFKVYVNDDNYTSTSGNKWLNFQDDDWYYIVNARQGDGSVKGVIFNYTLAGDDDSKEDKKGADRLLKVGGKVFLIGADGVMKVGAQEIKEETIKKWDKPTNGLAIWKGTTFNYYVPVTDPAKQSGSLYFYFDDSTDHDGDRGEQVLGIHSYQDDDGATVTRLYKQDGGVDAYAICNGYLFENGKLVVAEDEDYKAEKLGTKVAEYSAKNGKLTVVGQDKSLGLSGEWVVVDRNGKIKKSSSSKGIVINGVTYYIKDYVASTTKQ